MTRWWRYVQKIAHRHSAHEIARRVGLSASSVSRWRESAPKPETVRAFARAYGRPVIEAFIAAGYMQPEDLDKEHPEPISVEEAILEIMALDISDEEKRDAILLLLSKSGRTEPVVEQRRKARTA